MGYLLALLSLAAATGVRWALDPALGAHLPYVTYFVAVAFVASVTRLGPSLFSLVAGWWLADFLWYPPRYDWIAHLNTAEAVVGAAAYFMVGGASIAVCEAMRRARGRARQMHAELDMELIASSKAHSALIESEMRIGAFLENALDAMITMDHEGRIVHFNPAAEAMFGHSRQKAVGSLLADMIIPPRLRQQHWNGLGRFLETGEGPILGKRLEMPAIRASGEEFPVELIVTAVRVESGPPFFTGYIRDISQQKRDESQLKDALLRMQRSNLLKDEFLATLSHELRTPMTAILGWAQMLHAPDIQRRPEDYAEGLQIIERNARLQAQMIEDLLDMSRIMSGKIRLSIHSVKLGEIISAAVEAIRPAAFAKGVRLQNICDQSVSDIRGDPARLQQVVYNLLTNAVKFTPKDGKVQVVCRRVNSHIEISVSDTGPGIKPEFLPHVFERFRQEDGSITRQHAGLGLGLSIVKHLVELHGGTVQAASDGEGKGATFTIHLPVAIAIKPELPAGALAREHPLTSTTASSVEIDTSRIEGRTVLIVEDEFDARLLLCRLLRARGLECFEAADGEQALRLLESGHRPDLIISDLGMPRMNGYDLMTRIRRLPPEQGGATPGIALTAFARTEDRTRSLLAGYQLHLSKPVEISELLASIVRLLG